MTHPKRKSPDASAGKGFESLMAAIFRTLRAHGHGRVEKIDPGMQIHRATFDYQLKRNVFIANFKRNNPWPDFGGVIGKRHAVFEVKSKKSTHLPWRVQKASEKAGYFGGVTEPQVEEMLSWWRSGSLVGLFWENQGCRYRYFGMKQLVELEGGARKSLPWNWGIEIEPANVTAIRRLVEENHLEPEEEKFRLAGCSTPK